MTKVTAEHFRNLGVIAFARGESQPDVGTTWQSRARHEGWNAARRDALAEPKECQEHPECRGAAPSYPTFGCTDVDVFNPSAGQPKARVIVADLTPNDNRTDSTLRPNGTQPFRVLSRREFAHGPDTRPAAYLERTRFGNWAIRESGTDVWIHAGVKRKTHARNVAGRMGYRIVGAPQ